MGMMWSEAEHSCAKRSHSAQGLALDFTRQFHTAKHSPCAVRVEKPDVLLNATQALPPGKGHSPIPRLQNVLGIFGAEQHLALPHYSNLPCRGKEKNKIH